jgi:3-oxoacyl-[acyl-carrier-protein] synthase II
MKGYINSIYSMPIQAEATTDGFKIEEPNYSEVLGGGGDLRRMSRLVKMGMYASQQCLNKNVNTTFDAIIVGTGLGGVDCSHKFLTGIIDSEQTTLSPTPFIQSLPNSIAGQIALKHSCYGYVMTYVHRGFSFETALYDGLMLLEEKKNSTILVGGLDELTTNYSNSMKQAGHVSDVTKNADSDTNSDGFILGEGATFLQISQEKSNENIANILGVELLYHPTEQQILNSINIILNENKLAIINLDIVLLGACGDANLDQKINNLSDSFSEKPTNYFKNQCGEYYTSSGFALQVAIDTLNGLANDKSPKYALIINHYRDINYSIYLIEK